MKSVVTAKLPAVLVVDDEVRSTEALRRTLEEDFVVFCAASPEEAMALLDRECVASDIRIVLCDQRMPGMTGIQFLAQVRVHWPDVIRIILSGYTDAEDIIQGVNEAGIWQYLLKPWQPDQLLLTLKRAADLSRLQADQHRLSLELRQAESVVQQEVSTKLTKVRQKFGVGAILRAPGSPIDAVCALIRKVAPYDLNLLLTGESGTGKEMIARAVHYESGRAEKPFVKENCGALPDTLLESELFGYKRGAFTGAAEDRIGLFQQADGGTLFLDEIGETSPAFQVKLLRVLQEGEFRPLGSQRIVSVNVRVIAATNRDLEEDVRSGRFREDLYYRLATMALHAPPLRQRPGDIPVLANAILKKSAQGLGREIQGFTPEVLAAFGRYEWPGNVRQLQNEVTRMVALAEADWLDESLLSPKLRAMLEPGETSKVGGEPGGDFLLTGTLKDQMEQLEQRVLLATMARHQGNKSRAARELGLSRVGLRAKLMRHGLSDT